MKKLYIIGGTMGVGKTTVSQLLKEKLPRSVLLDGDWCWDMSPFQVTEETKSMVIDNICYLLNNFIKCSAFDNIIFCWVMHEQSIIDNICSRLDKKQCRCIILSLVCSEGELKRRLMKDIESGRRSADVIERSIRRISLYDLLDSVKIDTTQKHAEEVAEIISKL